MATLTVNIPDEIYAELQTVAEQLQQTPEQCLQLGLCYFLQTPTLDSALEGIARINTEVEYIDFPELKEAYGIDIKFHPMAIEELEVLDEEEQTNVLEELIDRISEDNPEAEEMMDLVLKEEPDHQIVLSEFAFGDLVYKIGQSITVYHIALAEEMFEEEDEGDTAEAEELHS
jgi:hypothetical protein